MVEHDGEFVAVHLDPLPAQRDETGIGGHQRPPFLPGQLLAAERRFDGKIQQTVHAETGAALLAHAHAHLRAIAAPVLPPVGDACDDAAGFERGNFSEKGVRLRGSPSLRLEDAAAVEQLTRPRTALGGLLHRFEQRAERGLILRAAFSYAENLVLSRKKVSCISLRLHALRTYLQGYAPSAVLQNEKYTKILN